MNEQKTSTTAIARVPVQQAGLKVFSDYMKDREGAVRAIAAKHIDPHRLTKIAIACVSKTPLLQKCTMDTIFTSVLQSAELGLEPSSALGEAYLVPYKQKCTLIVGYRGLISLAFRSGFIKSIQAREVYEGDAFEFEMGLEPKLRHVPSAEDRDPNKITHVYCVVHLKDGGIISDVMTKSEIDRIRARSAAGGSGPWSTDYAEMAKKTVTRRALKYAPMSVEMSKALAADNASDTGEVDVAALAEFDFSEGEFSVVEEEQAAGGHPNGGGTESVKDKLRAGKDNGNGKDSDPDEEQARRQETIEAIAQTMHDFQIEKSAIAEVVEKVVGKKLAISQFNTLTLEQLRNVHEEIKELAKN